MEPGRSRRQRRRPQPWGPIAAGLVLLLAAGAAGYYLLGRENRTERRQEAVARFTSAWTRGDTRAMYAELSAEARRDHPYASFARSYREAERAATITRIRTGNITAPADGAVRVPVAVRTRLFDTLRGSVTLPLVDEGDAARVGWKPSMRLPGLEPGERVRRVETAEPPRAAILGADGRRLRGTTASLAIVGTAPSGSRKGSGLQAAYDERLGGRAGARLKYGRRVIARTRTRRGRSLQTTLRPGLLRAASAALGDRLGGIAVVKPSNGDVLALAGLAVSAPQPPGSVFKIITLAGALQEGVARPTSSYPVQTAATLSGVALRNAGGGPCGGSLANATANSCNSVFAPLGARLGAKRLVEYAERFGFNARPRLPLAKPSTLARPSQMKDSLAVGAAAIGQDRDLATPLAMASATATIANRGVRAEPRLVRSQPAKRTRAVRRTVAATVRTMMVGVVAGGTGTAGAVPGVQVAGKTGTAELVPTAAGGGSAANTNAWFVAFAPAGDPEVAVAVMLVGGGAGGANAAPIASQVLRAAL